jgi:hypothetical protein
LCLDAANVKSYPGSGNTWIDLSGNGNDGTLTNGPTFNSDNKGSIIFDGVNDRIETGITAPFGTSLFSFEAWIYYTASQFGGIISKRTSAGTFQQVSLFVSQLSSGASGKKISFYHSDGTSLRSEASPLDYDGAWHHVVLSCDSDRDHLYIDGSLVISSSITSVPNLTLSPPLTVGALYDISDTYIQPFNGKIAVAKYYNFALTAIEVQQNFNALRGRFEI